MEVILYSTGCSRCKTLAMMLDKAKVPYDVNTCVEAMKALGMKTVPGLSVDGNLMNYEQAMLWANERLEDLDEEQ